MDKETVKLQLASYRPQDAADPVFADSLRAAETDPELAAWFADLQRFDAAIISKLRDEPVPADVKSHILLGNRPTSELPARHRHGPRWALAGSLAAALVIGLLSWHLLAPRRTATRALAQQAISFTNQMPALQFVCFDASEVANWINQQPGSQKVGLKLPKPAESMSMAMIGSSVVDWNGRPVVMVCLQHNQRMAMLYILNAADATDFPEGATETIQKADWVVQTTKTGGQVRLLTTKGTPADLNFPMPF